MGLEDGFQHPVHVIYLNPALSSHNPHRVIPLVGSGARRDAVLAFYACNLRRCTYFRWKRSGVLLTVAHVAKHNVAAASMIMQREVGLNLRKICSRSHARAIDRVMSNRLIACRQTRVPTTGPVPLLDQQMSVSAS